jgi:NAD-dependent dihydropyrimidine dehydrogenase PreA subunit
MFDVSIANTLQFDPAACNGCGMCLAICPHGVFARNGRGARNDRAVQLVRPEACMECGACQVNCPEGAIQVESGVGCAAAMFRAALLRQPTPTCG